MPTLPGYGEWNVAKSKNPFRSDPPFASLTVDFDNKTGTAEVGTGIGRPANTSPLTNISIISASKFSANYTFGSNKGAFEAEIDDHRRLDITFTGTVSTSCMGEPLKTRPPRILVDALRGLDRDAEQFATTSINDAGTKREYSVNVKKFNQEILADVRKGKLTPEDAAKTINLIRNAIAGVLASRWIAEVRRAAAGTAGAGTVAAAGPPRWGHLGTATVQEAFGNPTLADEAWVHFASSKISSSIQQSGVTTSVKSSWLRWGEAKALTYGELVWKMGPMSASSESDLAIIAIAPANAAITEVKGLYGFKVEGEATAAVTGVQVHEASSVKTLAAIEKSTGKTIAELEEYYAIKKFADAVKDRPARPGVRVFERLTKGEQNQVRLEIIESAMPVEARLPVSAGKWGKIGKCLMIVSIAISIYNISKADETLKQASREVVGFGGGLAAGAAFGATVSAVAPEAAPVIVGLSMFIGGVLGALGADFVFEWADNLLKEEEEY